MLGSLSALCNPPHDTWYAQARRIISSMTSCLKYSLNESKVRPEHSKSPVKIVCWGLKLSRWKVCIFKFSFKCLRSLCTKCVKLAHNGKVIFFFRPHLSYRSLLRVLYLIKFDNGLLWVMSLAYCPKIGIWDHSHQLLNALTNIYETWYVCHGTWAHLIGLLHRSLRSVCVSIRVSRLSLLGNGSVRCIIPFAARQRLGKHVPVATNTLNNDELLDL
jgi:hypothetical protein